GRGAGGGFKRPIPAPISRRSRNRFFARGTSAVPTVRMTYYEVEGALPDVCMKCGAPAATRKRKQFAWYPQWVFDVLGRNIFVGLLPFAIVALVHTKRMAVSMPFCARHRNYWLVRDLFLWGGLAVLGLACVVGLAVTIAMDDPTRLGGGGGGNSA